MSNTKAIIQTVTQELQSLHARFEDAQNEAWWIIECVTKKNRVALLAELHHITKQQEQDIFSCVRERLTSQKPLQYIIGHVPFCATEIIVKPPTLIPRPETEEWVHWLISLIQKNVPNAQSFPVRILDLCTGSGCIAIALAKAFPRAIITGVDISEQAITLARENAMHNNVHTVSFIVGDLFTIQKHDTHNRLFDSTIPHNYYDIIVSNPPYISSDDWHMLELSVKNWEDPEALISEDNGYAHYHALLLAAPILLRSDTILPKTIPSLIFEIGHNQAKQICELYANYSDTTVSVHTDLFGNHRWITGFFHKKNK